MSDLIRREDVLALWDKYHYEIATKAIEFDKALREMPSAYPKKGKLIKHGAEEGYLNPVYTCSECGEYLGRCPSIKFCSDCGADMRGEKR